MSHTQSAIAFKNHLVSKDFDWAKYFEVDFNVHADSPINANRHVATNSKVAPKVAAKSPRLVLMIGLPGSGKSTVLKNANLNQWSLLSADSLRARKAEKPDDVYSDRLRRWSYLEIAARLQKNIQNRLSTIIDGNNLTLQRVEYIVYARNAGYTIEAVYFLPQDPLFHLARIQERVQAGGVDLAKPEATEELHDQKRLAVICDMQAQHDLFIESLKLDPQYKNPCTSIDFGAIDFHKMKSLRGSLAELLANRAINTEFHLDKLSREDVINRLSVIELETPAKYIIANRTGKNVW